MTDALGLLVDVETTGLDSSDEIIEIGLVLFKYEVESGRLTELVDQYSDLREPSVRCSAEAFEVHGISPAMTKGKRLDEPRINTLFARAALIIAHNAAFDRRFVAKHFPTIPQRPWMCTMRDINWDYEACNSKRLDAIAEHYGIRRERQHRAIDDAKVLLSVLRRTDKLGLVHMRRMHRRAFGPWPKVMYRSETSGRLLKLPVTRSDAVGLVGLEQNTSINLWTRSDYDFVNGYLDKSKLGRGKVFAIPKCNAKSISRLLDGHDIYLNLTVSRDDYIEFKESRYKYSN